MPALIGQIHLYQHITREDASFGHGTAAVLDLDHLFGGNQDTTKRMLQLAILDPLYLGSLYAPFPTGMVVADKPTFAHECHLFKSQKQASYDPLYSFVYQQRQFRV